MVLLILWLLILLTLAGCYSAWALHGDHAGSAWLRKHLPVWLCGQLYRAGAWAASDDLGLPKADALTRAKSRIGLPEDAVGPALSPPAAFGAPQSGGSRPLPAAPAPAAASSAAVLNGIPADHAAVAARIASFEPETDVAMQEHLAGEAKGALARADASFELCETLAANIGIDPAFIQAAAYVAEAETEMATMYAGLGQRLQDIYQLPYEHIDNGGTLPDPPDWLTPEGGA